MSGFWDFFKIGFSNIVYLNVFVHILFIAAFCGIYTFKYTKLVAGFLLTFVCGYITTFLLSTFELISFPQGILEYLLPLTILVISVCNFFLKRNTFMNKYPPQNYRFYLGFISGCIHGLALPEVLKPLLTGDQLVMGILGFNLGIISALILFVLFLLLVTFILTYFIRVNIREWNLMLSGGCAGIALYIIANKIFF
ncbi:MAG TPA: HupE/UreJ family protein [Cytophagaceae bacterium]|jgi:small-conductance mechanosensitive channel